MSLFSILVDVAANTAQFQSEMKKVTSTLETVGNVVKSALEFGGISLGLAGLADSFTKAAQSGEQLAQISKRMGASVESLSQLQYAAEQTNVPFVALTGAIDILQKNLVLASEGSGKAKHAFEDLGVDTEKLASVPLDQKLDIIANRIAALPGPAQQTAAAMRIFGMAGADLLPILQQGAAGLDAFRARADSLGLTLSTDTVESLAKASSAITDMKLSTHALWMELSGDIAPAVTSFANTITKSLVQMRNTFDSITGAGSAQSQIAGLNAQAKELEDRINRLKGRSGWLANLIDANLIKDYTDLLDKLRQKITALTPLEPVTVTATKSVAPTEDLTDVLVRAAKINEDFMQQYYDRLNTMSQTDVETTVAAWDAKENAARQALAEGIIDVTEFQARMESMNDQFLQPVDVTAKTIAGNVRTVFADMQKYGETAATSIQASFANFLEDPSITGFKAMGLAWLQTLDKMVADAAAADVFKALFGDNTPTSGLSGLLSSGLGALFGGGGGGLSVGASAALDASASSSIDSALGGILGFANGGSFNVGGSGGTDSQLVAFKATPGENVQVGGGGNSSPITIQNYVTVTSPQVTKADVLGAMQQTQASTVAKLQDMKRRRQF